MRAALILTVLVLGGAAVLDARWGRWGDYVVHGLGALVDIAAFRRLYPLSERFLARGEGSL
jgi:hypothetical protein